MFRFDQFARVATAALGALILSTLSVAAAVGPGHVAGAATTAYASVHSGTRAHG